MEVGVSDPRLQRDPDSPPHSSWHGQPRSCQLSLESQGCRPLRGCLTREAAFPWGGQARPVRFLEQGWVGLLAEDQEHRACARHP